MFIVIRDIPHKQQRYPTCGDYSNWKDGEFGDILVSTMPQRKYMLLVAIHELVEAILCEDAGITIEQIDTFDIAYEKRRKKGDHSEPGDQPEAPYFHEHLFATWIESLIAEKLGVNWEEYNSSINTLA